MVIVVAMLIACALVATLLAWSCFREPADDVLAVQPSIAPATARRMMRARRAARR